MVEKRTNPEQTPATKPSKETKGLSSQSTVDVKLRLADVAYNLGKVQEAMRGLNARNNTLQAEWAAISQELDKR